MTTMLRKYVHKLESKVEKMESFIAEMNDWEAYRQKDVMEKLKAEVKRLKKPDCGWTLQGDYAETGCGQEVNLINEDMTWIEFCPYCGGPVLEEGE